MSMAVRVVNLQPSCLGTLWVLYLWMSLDNPVISLASVWYDLEKWKFTLISNKLSFQGLKLVQGVAEENHFHRENDNASISEYVIFGIDYAS